MMDEKYYGIGGEYSIRGGTGLLYSFHNCKAAAKDAGCKGCPGKLKFRNLDGIHCGFSESGNPLFQKRSS